MKRTLFIILLLLTCISIAQAENRLDIVDNKVIAETNNYIVHFESGTLTYLHNKQTNETYTTSKPSNQGLYNGFFFAGKLGHSDENETLFYARSFRLEKVAPLKVHMIYENSGVHLINSISIDVETGDIIFQQEATSEKPSLAQISWSVNDLKVDDLEIIVPSNDGIAIDNTSRDFINFGYPSLYWQAQLVICQSRNGGFFVRCEDTDFRYKSFNYKRENNLYRLSFIFENDAPFDDLKHIKSVQWRLNTYSGGWRVPARQYRDWMRQTFKPTLPEWTKEINTIIQIGHDRTTIPKLIEYGLDPKKTLLAGVAIDEAILGDGVNYTIKPTYAGVVEEAHKHGFKFIVVASAFGIFKFDTPIYEQFKKDWLKNPYSGGGRTYHENQVFINPASAEYRNFMVQQLRRIYETAPCDGFFLDANHIVENHAHGEIDGLRMPQGSVRLAQELREAMPGIVFIGEGVHEVTYTYENFSVHTGFTEGTNPHPISAFLFTPHVKGFAKFKNADMYSFKTSDELLNIYKTRGTLPDVYWWQSGLLEEEAEGQRWLSILAEWQRLSPPINLESDVPYQPHWTDIYLMPTIGVPADVNGDMVVNILDLVAVADHFGTTDSRYDVNYDGVVNILDLVIVSQEMSSQ